MVEMINQSKQFDISVVIPVYNGEDYLDEAIESIIEQNIGFKEHIQLVLINDGSTDSCEEICLKYLDQYPDNIVYRYKDNGGVSSACNMGLELASGRLVNFFGADDKWALDSFGNVLRFFDSHYEEIDMVCCRVEYFGSYGGEHPLNYKYERDAVIDLIENPEYLQCGNGNCFFKRSAIENIRFETRLRNAEDALFVNEVLLGKCKLGVIKSENATYLYRRHTASSGFTNTKYNRYVVEPELFARKLYSLSRERYGKVLPFIAYTIMYEMQWRIVEEPTDDITEEQIRNYEAILKELLQEIDDEYIVDQKSLTVAIRAYVFRLKYGHDFFEKVRWSKGRAWYKDRVIYTLRGRLRCVVGLMETQNDRLIIKATTDIEALGQEYRFFIRDNDGEIHYPEIQDFAAKDIIAFNKEPIVKGKLFKFDLPLKNRKSYQFYVSIGDHNPFRLKPFFDYFGKLNHRLEDSYWVSDEHIIKFRNEAIAVYDYGKKTHFRSEIRYLKGLLKNKEVFYRSSDRRKNIFYRLLYYISGLLLKNKRIWLISDGDERAPNNGASLFKYIVKKHLDNEKRVFFAVKKTSVDYGELKEYGPVVVPGSLKYKMLYLHADKIITAYSYGSVIDSFFELQQIHGGLMNHDYIYLQHGIMQEKPELWLNALERNIKLFVVSAEKEMRAVLGGSLGYGNDTIKLLGMPRFDALREHGKKPVVAIIPTWRNGIAGRLTDDMREREYMPDFSETDYCVFYNKLINDPRLKKTLTDNDMEGWFYIHPNYVKQHDDFMGNEIIKVKNRDCDYSKILGEASILITDYSGVQFDFAYQRKPVIYSHYDSTDEDVETNHKYDPTCFDYHKDGFGPVAESVEEVVDHLEKIISENCEVDKKYRNRMDAFFRYDDYNNSERVYNALIDMDKDRRAIS